MPHKDKKRENFMSWRFQINYIPFNLTGEAQPSQTETVQVILLTRFATQFHFSVLCNMAKTP